MHEPGRMLPADEAIMADQFTEVSETGLGGNLIESIKGVAVGLVLFVVSFPVLWWNEGRVDLSQVAKKAVVVKTSAVDPAGEGKLVSVTGTLQSPEQLGDPQFLVPGPYIRLERVVEMYAWTEHKKTTTQKKLGGGKTETTTYTYDTEWTERPTPAAQFRDPQGHENPSLPVSGEVFTVHKAEIGAYSFSPADAELPSGPALRLRRDLLKTAAPAEDDRAAPAGEPSNDEPSAASAAGSDEEQRPVKKAKKRRHHGRPVRVYRRTTGPRPAAGGPLPDTYDLAGDTYLFRGAGTPDRPRVGDVRVSFKALPAGQTVTLYGQQHGGEVGPYLYKGETRFFRALSGTHEEAVATLATEHSTITWILRLVGFLMMWFGLMLFFGPINAVLDILPFLGTAGRFLTGLVLLPVSILLSTIVIILSIIAHSPVLLALTLAGLGVGGYLLYQKRRAQRR